ncbi:MAG TPA: glutamine-hydrolyzing GMP synthase, partial [Patescibacteria group bacterium]|nr:glutamine-hydrolyzing GMP synthase [Patescibacteria group bacterium]
MKHVAILDFGSQYTHLISRNIRELNVLSKIYHHDVSALELRGKVWGIILSGGPQFISDGESSIKVDPEIFNLGVPILGLCYGHQLIAHMLGGEVRPGNVREYGRATLEIVDNSNISSGIDKLTQVWMSHGDTVKKIPEGFKIIASTSDCPVAIMANDKEKIYGFQFHPEVVHTDFGIKFIENFVLNICQAEQSWKMDDIISDLSEKIKQQAKGKKVFV